MLTRVILLSALDSNSFVRILNNYKEIIVPVGAAPKGELMSYLQYRENLVYRLNFIPEIKYGEKVISTPFLGSVEKSYILMHPMCKITQSKYPTNFLDYSSNADFFHKGKSLIDLVKEGDNFVWFQKDKQVIPYILVPIYKYALVGAPIITKRANVIEIAYNSLGSYYLKIEALENKKLNLIVAENKDGNEQELERVLLE